MTTTAKRSAQDGGFSSKRAFSAFVESTGKSPDDFVAEYPSHHEGRQPTKAYFHRLKKIDTASMGTIKKCAGFFGVSLQEYMSKGWV